MASFPDQPDVPGLLAELPVAGVLADVIAAARGGAVVVTAPPGSGKTMLVPAAVGDDLPASGRVMLLQPRRLAARSVAGQIARLRGVPLGGEVGYRVRFDSRCSRDTRLVVETTGIMLRRMLDDIALDGIGAVVLDEFHERSLELDLVLGLLVRVRQTLRPDLRIVVMSATLAAEPVARLLATTGCACPVIATAGRMFPVAVRYLRHGDRRELVARVAEAVPAAFRETAGHVLVFLPGVGEIQHCQRELTPLLEREGHAVLALFGDLPAEQQDRVLADVGRRKLILATNVAETSLTIPGVTAVIDSGLARQARVAPETGLPRLELVPISRASAEQRAGRAGRTEAGICWRLWDEASHHQRPSAEVPEVLRGDLAAALLQLLAVGEADDFPWLDPPPATALDTAGRLLGHLGAAATDAVGRRRITPLGRDLARLPTHPRLARLLWAGAEQGALREAALAAALLSERDPFRPARHAGGGPRDRVQVRTRSDVVDRVRAIEAFPGATGGRSADVGGPAPTSPGLASDPDLELHPAGAANVLRVAAQLERLVEEPDAAHAADPGPALMRSLLAAFPDRLARLRPGALDRGTLVGGRGVRLDRGSRVRGEPLFLAIDVDDAAGEAGVRLASAVDRDWLALAPLGACNLATAEELGFHPSRRQVEARRVTRWLDLVLDETPVAVADESAAASILAREAAAQLPRILPAADTAAGGFLIRARWLAAARPDLALPALDEAALAALLPGLCHGLRSLDALRAADWLAAFESVLGPERVAEVNRLAPAALDLPTGRRHRLDYAAAVQPGGAPVLAARIQELFGVPETPRVAGGRIAVIVHLLGPNHRPQQVTADLASFWRNTYPSVRAELKRRYPKHAWPERPG